MTILFMGGEMGAFVPGGSGEAESTSGTRYDTTFSRCAIAPDGPASDPDLVYVETARWTPETEGYLHFYLIGNNSVVTHDVATFYDASDTQIFRLRTTPITGGYTFTLQYLNAAAAWVTAGTFDTATFDHFDIYWKIHASGGMRMWAGGTSKITLSATDLSHLSGVEYIRLHGWGVGGYYSQVVVTDNAEPTVGGRLLTFPVTGAGASSDFTGTFANIDEVVYSDADFIFSSTANHVSTFSHATTIPTGYVLRAVGVTARAKRGASGPQNFQLALRATGTTAFSSTIALDVGYTANCAVWETNPTTAAAWVNGDFAGLQPGVKAIA